MTWLSVIGSISYYLLLPISTLLGWLLVALAPVLHLGGYLFSACLLPLRVLAKLEVFLSILFLVDSFANILQTLYIYLGVAAVIGLITGSILHLSSTLLVSLFKLTPIPEEKGRSAVSVRVSKEQKKLEEAWQSSSLKSNPSRLGGTNSLGNDYAEWLEKDAAKRREDELFKQTILEEDDDSD
jgi:hypothetical protein